MKQLKNIFAWLARSYVLVVICFLFTFSAFAQDNKDTVATKEKEWYAGIFIAGGANITQYYSDAFFNYLFDKTFHTSNYASPGSYLDSGYNAVNVNKSKLNYSRSSVYPIIRAGVELNSSKHKNLHHVIEVSYTQCSGNFSRVANYQELGTETGAEVWRANVNDTIQSKYTQKVISLGYKFQPVYKFVFFSIGINCMLNLIKVEQQIKENVNGTWSEPDGTHSGSYSKSDVNSTKNSNFYFINFPFQVGAGGYIKIKQTVLKPAFYFTSCFINGYNFYNVSLDILLNFKKPIVKK